MNAWRFGADDASNIAFTAFVVLVGGATLLHVVTALAAKARGKGKKRPFAEIAMGVGILLVPFAALATVIAIPLGTSLLAIPLSRGGWILVAVAAAFFLYRATRMRGYGIEGCTKLIACVMMAYALVWALTALFSGAGAAAGGEAVEPVVESVAVGFELLRSLLVALPFVLFVGFITDKQRSAFLLGLLIMLALTANLAFVPVEEGRVGWLPQGDALRFPIVGALAMMAWTLPWIAGQLIFDRRKFAWKMWRNLWLVLGATGALMGGLWVLLRVLF